MNCRQCKAPLGLKYAEPDETGIERAISDDLCNCCYTLWRLIKDSPYWTEIQRVYEFERCDWKRDLDESGD